MHIIQDPKSGAYLTHVKMNAVNAVGSDPRMIIIVKVRTNTNTNTKTTITDNNKNDMMMTMFYDNTTNNKQ